MKKILRQPLLHFLLIGLSFFLLFQLFSRGKSGDTKTIVVDKQALMTHLQYRSKAFNQEVFEEKLAAMPEEELKELIDEYVREEVLYREAKAMGLDKEDYIIKRRMIQKVEFIAEGISEATLQLSEKEIRQYYKDNRDDYYVQPYVTFTHVFFSFEQWEREQAAQKAKDELAYLNRNKLPFEKATSRGDRFYYHTNYVEREPDYVISHFGTSMTKSIFQAEPSKEKWIGPFESSYGYHVVMLSSNVAGRYQELDEIKEKVSEDTERWAVRNRNEEAIREIVNSYEVKVTFGQ